MNIVIIGSQWGDEGKGKIVDFLAPHASLIVRFSGGANAGHTIVVGEKTYKLHLIPSGIVYPDKLVVLGIGMVIDFEALFKEMQILTEQGIKYDGRIFISDRAHIVLPRYKKQDIEEDKKRKKPIGTTGRGIGITYSHKALRDGIRIGDLYDNYVFNELDKADRDYLHPYREKIKNMVVSVADFIQQYSKQNILFEGAQGTLLDPDIGTYPFVSSGMSSASGAALGGGIGPRRIDKIIAVIKAYSSRVGNGPFPSQFSEQRDGQLEHTVRELGREYGVTTGRPRRCGYLDLVALRYACLTNSVDSLALTHLDVYDKMDDVKACTAYNIDGKRVKNFPASVSLLERAKPVTESFTGWKKSIKDCNTYQDLPTQAKNYISFIEQYVNVPVGIISVGYRRKETIVRTDPWKKS